MVGAQKRACRLRRLKIFLEKVKCESSKQLGKISHNKQYRYLLYYVRKAI